MLKNPGRLLREGKSEIALASKISLSILLWIWANIVASLKLKLWSVSDICWTRVFWKFPNLISRLCSYKRFLRVLRVSPMYFLSQSLHGIAWTPASDFIGWWDPALSKLLIDLDEIVTIFIPRLCKLFSMELMEELLGKIMYLWGSFVILEDVLVEV